MTSTADHTTQADFSNDHIAPERLQSLLKDQIAELQSQHSRPLSLRWLGKQKEGTDTTTKVLVKTAGGQSAAVIVCARPASPDLIARSSEMAEQVRRLIGPRLGRVIPQPIAQGVVDGRSYVILPCYREFSSWKPLRVCQRLRLRRPLLNWLREACREAAETIQMEEVTSPSFRSQLQYLHELHFVDGPIRWTIELLLNRLDAQIWRPRHTFDHNDLWLGNIMLPRRDEAKRHRAFPFILIDWGGANPHGYGMYDLVRIGKAFKLSDRALLREVQAHAHVLGCDPYDTRGHLLASLARLHRHLEHFPEERYIATFRSCWNRLDGLLTRHGEGLV